MNEIAAASAEQTTGIEQVNVAVTRMDDVTQQNAALVEQASAATSAMADQARRLREGVSVFRVGHGDARDAGESSDAQADDSDGDDTRASGRLGVTGFRHTPALAG